MQEKLLYISASNICVFKPRWVYCQHARCILFLFFCREIPSPGTDYRGHPRFWQDGTIVHLVNFFTAWKVFITKCQRDMLSLKLWSHCLHSAHNQFVLSFSWESLCCILSMMNCWCYYAFIYQGRLILIHLQHTTKTIHLDCWSLQSLFNNPNELFVTLLIKWGECSDCDRLS